MSQDHLESDNSGDDKLPAGAECREITIGIDYGTTYTSVSYLGHAAGNDGTTVYPEDVKAISNYPEDLVGISFQVPTEHWYSAIPIARSLDTGILEPDPVVGDSSSTSNDEIVSSSSIVSVGERPARVMSPRFDRSGADDETSPELSWGYECPYQRHIAHTTRSGERHVKCVKLMLLDTDHTEEGRQALRPVVENLIGHEIIRKHEGTEAEMNRRVAQDMIMDFFVVLLRHTKQELIACGEYTVDCRVKFALSLPVIFSQESRRTLQWSLEEAIRITKFGTMLGRNIDNLFLVTEPKAAATFLLATSRDLTVSWASVVHASRLTCIAWGNVRDL